ncbi:rab-GTPase-TBC domain-containing protein [Limtongia smithiae]|uniref:rab-GTPase-TBC domain-containing protein n=1 Tax=Limtongia smithiae TaxID=1125753 RepID=UPI0034CEC946
MEHMQVLSQQQPRPLERIETRQDGYISSGNGGPILKMNGNCTTNSESESTRQKPPAPKLAVSTSTSGNGTVPTSSPSAPPSQTLAPTVRSKYEDVANSTGLLAGGTEDWTGVTPATIDRFGFIKGSPKEDFNSSRPPASFGERFGRAFHELFKPVSARQRAIRARAALATGTRSGNDTNAVATERRREDKWRAMATRTTTSSSGAGTDYVFPITDPLLVSRTFKGVPDALRAAAWRSFLFDSSPAGMRAVEARYAVHLAQSSTADGQIDLDVPRTIDQHVLFRRRYGGGQRLLFRVLHALSLEFEDVGYVQGMAPLAAAMLCYYDEAQAFAVLARVFTARGVADLYADSFAGLLAAQRELQVAIEERGLAGKKAAAALIEMGLEPALYTTKWYLTLFAYVVPFATQMRIWDVFFLLGGIGGKGRLVLHAAALALVATLADRLVTKDMEIAMVELTRGVDISDPDLFMTVVEWEYKQLLKTQPLS